VTCSATANEPGTGGGKSLLAILAAVVDLTPGTELHVNLTVQAVGAFAQEPRLTTEFVARLTTLLRGCSLCIARGGVRNAPERKFLQHVHSSAFSRVVRMSDVGMDSNHSLMSASTSWVSSVSDCCQPR